MSNADRTPAPWPSGQPERTGWSGQAPPPRQPDAGAAEIAEAVVDRIGDKVSDSRGQQPDIPSVSQAIALRDQAPEMYDLWLKIAKDKAATANYVERAPYEVPERLAQSGRPRALGALIIVLSFCGYLAWLGGPGPYIGGLIAILDLGVMFGMFFGLRPERLPDPKQTELGQPARRRRRLAAPSSHTSSFSAILSPGLARFEGAGRMKSGRPGRPAVSSEALVLGWRRCACSTIGCW
jgi:hypothetical protein